MLSILSLAEAYQVLKVKARCEDCIIQTLQLTTKGVPQIDTRTLLYYAANAELYNLSSALPLVVQMCAKYDEQLLKQDGHATLLSERMLLKIAQERIKLLQNLTIFKVRKGNTQTSHNVGKTFCVTLYIYVYSSLAILQSTKDTTTGSQMPKIPVF